MEPSELDVLRRENAELRRKLAEKESGAGEPKFRVALPSDAISRYSRHLLVRQFGVDGQRRLMEGSVLIVGAGGLGCPALQYLAAAGVGRIGVVDADVVSLSNLHRQVLFAESDAGLRKVDAAAAAIRRINSSTRVDRHFAHLGPGNALALVGPYDVVLDCSDNPATRYTISDACVLAGKPLVSGAALGVDGQLSVLCGPRPTASAGNDDDDDTDTVPAPMPRHPCYRCMHPQAPQQDACQSCADGGVLGPVVGAVGALQAVEAVKVLAKVGNPLWSQLLVYDALAGRVRVVRMRGRRTDCIACGDAPTITDMDATAAWLSASGLAPFEDANTAASLAAATQHAALPQHRVLSAAAAAAELAAPSDGNRPWWVVDVRAAHQFHIVALPQAVNVPLLTLQRATRSNPDEKTAPLRIVRDFVAAAAQEGDAAPTDGTPQPKLMVLCRRGVDSQVASRILLDAGAEAWHVAGGLEAWAQEVDASLPMY